MAVNLPEQKVNYPQAQQKDPSSESFVEPGKETRASVISQVKSSDDKEDKNNFSNIILLTGALLSAIILSVVYIKLVKRKKDF